MSVYIDKDVWCRGAHCELGLPHNYIIDARVFLIIRAVAEESSTGICEEAKHFNS